MSFEGGYGSEPKTDRARVHGSDREGESGDGSCVRDGFLQGSGYRLGHLGEIAPFSGSLFPGGEDLG